MVAGVYDGVFVARSGSRGTAHYCAFRSLSGTTAGFFIASESEAKNKGRLELKAALREIPRRTQRLGKGGSHGCRELLDLYALQLIRKPPRCRTTQNWRLLYMIVGCGKLLFRCQPKCFAAAVVRNMTPIFRYLFAPMKPSKRLSWNGRAKAPRRLLRIHAQLPGHLEPSARQC